MRVSQFLADQHVAFEEVLHPPAFTAQRLARWLHVSGRQVMKSILVKGPRGFFLVVLPAAQRIDLSRLSVAMGGSVRLAAKEELDFHFPDCEWGALMPFGRLYDLTTILEATTPLDATVVFEAQRHAVAIKMLCRDYVKLERPERLAFAFDQETPERHRPQAG
jgi:Ala-tRNA(Pro) deacylase